MSWHIHTTFMLVVEFAVCRCFLTAKVGRFSQGLSTWRIQTARMLIRSGREKNARAMGISGGGQNTSRLLQVSSGVTLPLEQHSHRALLLSIAHVMKRQLGRST